MQNILMLCKVCALKPCFRDFLYLNLYFFINLQIWYVENLKSGQIEIFLQYEEPLKLIFTQEWSSNGGYKKIGKVARINYIPAKICSDLQKYRQSCKKHRTCKIGYVENLKSGQIKILLHYCQPFK